MLVVSVFLVMENKKSPPRLVALTTLDKCGILYKEWRRHTQAAQGAYYVAASFQDLETRTWIATSNYLAVLAFITYTLQKSTFPMKWNVVVFAVIYRQQTTNGLSWAEQNPEKSLILSTSNDTCQECSSQMDNQHEHETFVVSSLFLICRLIMFVTAFHLLAIVLFWKTSIFGYLSTCCSG